MIKPYRIGFIPFIGVVLFCQTGAAFPQGGTGAAPVGDSSTDYSKESYVIERLTEDVAFNADGTGQDERGIRVRIQSDAAVQEFGVLSLSYRNSFERLEVLEIRVLKPDGTVITTPESDAQDVQAEVTRTAPAYSDTREKQIPIKGLGVGDVLEWRARTIHTTPEVPDQFWYAYNFFTAGVVLDETLRITVPAGKYVKTSSPELSPAMQQENGRVTYVWKTSQREAPKEGAANKQPAAEHAAAVQITTFRNWEEVGRWYGALQKSRVEVSPAVQAKAAELIRGLTTNAEKERAIYEFVSTKFRYISISFGQGRYQPHSSEEVLTNQYGDCKDKHTLFAALLKAAGIESWPVLIAAGIEFNPDIPSPGQFNHLITYIPGAAPGEPALWADTTPGVAPFGMLQAILRDKKALVIPDDGAPRVMTTPEALPFRADESTEVKATLTADGTLTGHFEISARGDSEILLKSIFHAAAPSKWTQLAQSMAEAMGFAGTVSSVAVDNPGRTETPFHYSYDYKREKYSDWENRRILPALPPFGLEGGAAMDKPGEPLFIGAPGAITYHAAIQLPEGYAAVLPSEVKFRTEFAEYSATYSIEKGVFSATRVLTKLRAKVPLEQWTDFQKLAKAMTDDESRFIQLEHSTGTPIVTRDDLEASDLVRSAALLIQKGDYTAATDKLTRAEQKNPQQAGLWGLRGFIYGRQNQFENAADALQKEIKYHPSTPGSYATLVALQRQLGRKDEMMATLRQWVSVMPGNLDAVRRLVAELMKAKLYDEALEPLRAAVRDNPEDLRLQIQLLEALIRDGKASDASALSDKLRDQKMDRFNENEIAYVLTDTGTELAAAMALGEKAVAEFEQQSQAVTLPALTQDDLRNENGMGMTWDTLGWAYFRGGELTKAEKFVEASWKLLQHATVADHLGQIYQKQGRKSEAAHMYRLALAVQSDMPETRQRLTEVAGGAEVSTRFSPVDELSQMRSFPVADVVEEKGSAEFFALISSGSVTEARFINGDEKLKSAGPAISKTAFAFPFPDKGPEKLVRRGILSCSKFTKPQCNFVLLPLANTKP